MKKEKSGLQNTYVLLLDMEQDSNIKRTFFQSINQMIDQLKKETRSSFRFSSKI